MFHLLSSPPTVLTFLPLNLQQEIESKSDCIVAMLLQQTANAQKTEFEFWKGWRNFIYLPLKSKLKKHCELTSLSLY